MSALLELQHPELRSQHATSEEYSAFTRQRPTVRSGDNLLKAFRRFIQHYPDLDQWCQAPLAERIGHTKPRAGKTYISALARPYLYYLAMKRELSFDWHWIIGVRCHVLTDELLPPAVALFIRELVDEGVRLGYKRRSKTARLSRIMKALYLHYLAPAVTEITEEDVAAFEDALVSFGKRPDLETFFDSDETYRQVAKQYRQAIYSLRLVLYHRGKIAVLPERQRSALIDVGKWTFQEKIKTRVRRVQIFPHFSVEQPILLEIHLLLYSSINYRYISHFTSRTAQLQG